jgi:hypothetical protein
MTKKDQLEIGKILMENREEVGVKKVSTKFVVIDGSHDIHVISDTEERAEQWITWAEQKYRGTTYLIHEVQYIG